MFSYIRSFILLLLIHVVRSMRTADSFDSFKNALRDQEEVIVVSTDMSVSSTIFVGHNTSISSNRRKLHSLDGNGHNQIMVVTGEGDVLLEDLEFKNGYTEGSGGALSVLGGATVEIIRCTFTSSHADIGGAVYVSSSNLNIMESIFSSNSARDGSAIYASFGAVKVTDTTISNNKASHDGGAMVLKTSHCDISRSTFQANSAASGGAVAALQQSVLTVDEGLFKKNTAAIGAAIFLSKSTGGMTKSVLENGKADQGGAVAAQGASLTTLSCSFRKNMAHLGGAVWFDTGDWIEEFSSFVENTAEMMGGGMFLGDVKYKSAETIFRNNVPEQSYTVAKTAPKPSDKRVDESDQAIQEAGRRRLTAVEDPIDIIQSSPQQVPLFLVFFCSVLSSILIVSNCTRKRQHRITNASAALGSVLKY